jgi:hypothetical protein
LEKAITLLLGKANDTELRHHHRPAKDRADEEEEHDNFPGQRECSKAKSRPPPLAAEKNGRNELSRHACVSV